MSGRREKAEKTWIGASEKERSMAVAYRHVGRRLVGGMEMRRPMRLSAGHASNTELHGRPKCFSPHTQSRIAILFIYAMERQSTERMDDDDDSSWNQKTHIFHSTPTLDGNHPT